MEKVVGGSSSSTGKENNYKTARDDHLSTTAIPMAIDSHSLQNSPGPLNGTLTNRAPAAAPASSSDSVSTLPGLRAPRLLRGGNLNQMQC